MHFLSLPISAEPAKISEPSHCGYSQVQGTSPTSTPPLVPNFCQVSIASQHGSFPSSFTDLHDLKYPALKVNNPLQPVLELDPEFTFQFRSKLAAQSGRIFLSATPTNFSTFLSSSKNLARPPFQSHHTLLIITEGCPSPPLQTSQFAPDLSQPQHQPTLISIGPHIQPCFTLTISCVALLRNAFIYKTSPSSGTIINPGDT